jgi:protein tyrosine phosphatase (PTP) superfamily phosphohydrolase (DUF442 family)
MSNCGGCSGLLGPCSFFSRVRARVFNRTNGAADCCEPGMVIGTPVESSAPATVLTPGVSPSYPASGTTRSVVTPGSTDSSTELYPADPPAKVKVVPPPSGGGAARQGGPQGASYQTRGQDSGARLARRRTDYASKTTVTTPEPTLRSARAASRSDRADQAPGEADPLENIPPLDLPGDAPSSSTPPVPPAAQPGAEPGAAAAKKPDKKIEAPAPAANEIDLTSITLPVPAPSASVGPGLARFVAVDLKLAGGSLPSPASLDWLVEKGYRTLLDLRESSEVSPTFIADVTKRGLRYVALPVGPGSIDAEHVRRFAFEVAAADARPMYFFDSDGTRSGALWYIRRIATDRVDQQVARREAEELGLSDQTSYWSAATKYISSLGPAETTSTSKDVSG